MYQGSGILRDAPRIVESPSGAAPEAAARLALDRVRKALTAHAAGVRLDASRMLQVLSAAPALPGREAERPLALGWLHWLEGNYAGAEPLLAEAVRLARRQEGVPLLAESAYWCARIRVLLGRADAVAEYETVLRETRGAPQAVAWLVDLLWRAGRVDRADAMWKSLRANKKVTACDERPLLEARVLLRRGEAGPAERLLNEAAPGNGVVQVEQRLLLAWTLTTLKQYDRAKEQFELAKEGPYPPAALENWRVLLEKRGLGQPAAPEEAGRPAALTGLLSGYRALQEGRTEEAVAAFREAASAPAGQSFSRYALACLGHDDPAAVLASQPGMFLALRCRARAALERFRQRQATPAEWLDAVQQAASVGWKNAAADHFRRLAQALQSRQTTGDDVHSLAADGPADPAMRANLLRTAVELAVRRLPVPEALGLLLQWSSLTGLKDDIAALLSRQLLRLLLLRQRSVEEEDAADPAADVVLAAVERLAPGDSLASLVRTGIRPDASFTACADAPPAARLWQAAQVLASGNTIDKAWHEEMRGLRSQGRLKGLAQSLLLLEAARRGDAGAVASLLEEMDPWRGFRPAPPRCVTEAVAAIVAAQPNHPGWRRALGRWLPLWEPAALGPTGATLTAQAGLAPTAGAAAKPPAGAQPAPWFLHQAARSLGRDDAEALAYVRRALKAEPELAISTEALRDALPELERRAQARALADAARQDDAVPVTPTTLVVDMVDLMAGLPQGADLLEAAAEGDLLGVHSGLNALAGRPDLPARLAHHLALLETRAAVALEDADRGDDAEPCWRGAWRLWLRFLANPELPAGADAGQARTVMLDHLLGDHRRRVADLLARNAVDAARRHWDLVGDLPKMASDLDETLGRDLGERTVRFRDDLATDYLLATREAMRYGAIPEGWRADYSNGVSGLLRLLSLDRDNLRLLTAMVEICDEWFLDLYNADDARGLADHVERFTPFSAQLARLVEDRPGDLAARAALSDFYKFRGFTAVDRARKADLYREALRFNPGNDNVRGLLKDLGEPADASAPPATVNETEKGDAP